ncbi:MAG: hypothetical protein KJ052_22095, partial [Candidatus Hydrogenedentes bacterium]|nr:hypothetical protein [Candidatus Hydrogenedentota bacterium]
DEIQDPNADLQDWYYAEVISENACAVGILGAVNAGDAFIEIRVTAGRNFTLLDDEVFAVPQGGNPNFIDHRIPLTITEDLGGGIFFLTNAEDIETRVFPKGGEPRQGDIIADGHAALYIQLGGFGSGNPIIGHDLNTGQVEIIDQAVYGRHFLIDTIAPYIDLGAIDTNGFADGFVNAFDLVPTDNDEWVSGENHAARHPFPQPPQILFDTGEFWSPNPIEAPVDYLGQLLLPPLVPPTIGTQIFFNNSSLAQWPEYDPSPNAAPSPRKLDFLLTLDFEDPPVIDYTVVPPVPIENGPNDFDIYNPGLGTREVSGFLREPDGRVLNLSVTDGPYDVDEFLDDINPQAEIQWIFRRNQTQFRSADPTIEVTYTISGLNEGFSKEENSAAPGTVVPFANNLLNGQFDVTLLDDLIALTEIYHIELQFQARDCAGNVTEQEFIVDPLHLWWLTRLQTQINPNREGQEVRNPSFTWQLDRSFETNVQGGPRPAFSYILLGEDDPSGYATGRYE